MRHREAAEFEIRVQRLNIAQHRVAGGGIAVMADGDAARQPVDHRLVAEIVPHRAQAAMGVEFVAVKGDDARRFLAAVLQGVQTQGGHGGGVGYVPDAEHAAFLVEGVVLVARVSVAHGIVLKSVVGGVPDFIGHAEAFLSPGRRPVARAARRGGAYYPAHAGLSRGRWRLDRWLVFRRNQPHHQFRPIIHIRQ